MAKGRRFFTTFMGQAPIERYLCVSAGALRVKNTRLSVRLQTPTNVRPDLTARDV
jgi:hypothetical protein